MHTHVTLITIIIILAIITLVIVFPIPWDKMTVKKRRTILWILLSLMLIIIIHRMIDVFQHPNSKYSIWKTLMPYFLLSVLFLFNFFRLYFKKAPAEHPTEETEEQ